MKNKKTFMLLPILLALWIQACAEKESVNEPKADEPKQETAAHAGQSEKPSSSVSPRTPPTTFQESPLLSELVAGSELPPVKERLPVNPRVLPVYEKIGQYGGTWHRAYTGISDRWGLTKLIEEHIVEFYMPNATDIDIVPNWADEFLIKSDSTEYEFHIREGLKWSDGVAVTTEDVRFWYEDVFLNKTLVPFPPEHLTINGKPLEVEIVDAHTFKVKFAAPYPFFPEIIAKKSTSDTRVTLHSTTFLMPFHYLKGFHPTYTSAEALGNIVAARGVDTWTDLWGSEGPITSWWLNPELPVITAWKIKTPPPAEEVVMVRNPYYFAVDSAGNQLPYIDEIVHTLIKEPDDLTLLAVQGQLDMQDRHIRRSDYTFLKLNEVQGDYRVLPWVESGAGLFLNLNSGNENLSGLFEDIRFRHALSVSLNRWEIREVVFNGLGKISQAGPMTASPHYDPELAGKWIEYDPDKANTLLDELGLTQRDADGFRLTSQGKALEITITYPDYLYGELMSDLIKEYWIDIGLNTKWDLVDRAAVEAKVAQNEIEGLIYLYARNLIIPADPDFFLGTVRDGTWMPSWGKWRESNGALGTSPPMDHPIRQVWNLWDMAKVAPSRDEANGYIQEMVDLHRENIWVIGIISELPVPVIISNSLYNVPEFGMALDDLRGTGITQPAQFFFDKP